MTEKERETYYSFVKFDHPTSYVLDRRIYPMTRSLPILKAEDVAYVIQNIKVRMHVLGHRIEKETINSRIYFNQFVNQYKISVVLTPHPADLTNVISRYFGERWIGRYETLPESGAVYISDPKEIFENMFVDTSEFTWYRPYHGMIEAKTLREICRAFSKMTRAYITAGSGLWFGTEGNAHIYFNGILYTNSELYGPSELELEGTPRVYRREKRPGRTERYELRGFNDVANGGETASRIRFSVGRGYVEKGIVLYLTFWAHGDGSNRINEYEWSDAVVKSKRYIVKCKPTLVEEDEDSHELIFELSLADIDEGIKKGKEICEFGELEGCDSFGTSIEILQHGFAICDIIESRGDCREVVTIPYN